MAKKFWTVITIFFICIGLATSSIVSLTLSWFLLPDVKTNDEYLDGEIGLRNYFFTGDGSEEKPYEIVSPIHFYNLARLQNLGIFPKTKYFQVGHYFDVDDNPETPDVLRCISGYRQDGTPIFAESLDMEDFCRNNIILPIGSEGTPFYGHFDGKGMPIENLIVSGNPEDIGVFGYVSHEGSVKGLVCSDLLIKSLGYNASTTARDKDNLLFSQNIDDIFSDASYLNSACLRFFKYDEGAYVNVSGVDRDLKHQNGLNGTMLPDINSDEHMVVGSRDPETNEPTSWFYNGYFTYQEPEYTGAGHDPFTYSWKSSSPLIKSTTAIDGSSRIAIDLTPLRDSSSFNTKEKMQIDARLSLTASVEVDGFVFSRVIQSYTVEFYSNGYTWNDAEDEKYYSAAIFCDYAGETTADDKNTNYHHGNNIGFLTGHLDGTMENCYVYNGTFDFNNSGGGYVKVPSETDSGLIGEIGTNIKNNIEADLGLVVNGDIGIMNFSKIYSLIRDDFSATTYIREVANESALPKVAKAGDYCLITKPTQRWYIIWDLEKQTWFGGINPADPNNPANNPYYIEDWCQVEANKDSVTIEKDGEEYYLKDSGGKAPKAPGNLLNHQIHRIKTCPRLYVVWNSSLNRWDPYFKCEWDTVSKRWEYTSEAPTTGYFLNSESPINQNNIDNKFDFGIPNTYFSNVGDSYKVTETGNYHVWNGNGWDVYESNPKKYYGGRMESKSANYYSYLNVVNKESIGMFSDYLRYWSIDEGQKQYISGTTKNLSGGSNPTWKELDLPSPIPVDYNSVDFLWNRVIQDEKGKNRGLGVFKVVSSYNKEAREPDAVYTEHRFDNLGECMIINGTPRSKVYFSTAEYDHTLGDGTRAWPEGQPLRASTLPSYSDPNSFKWPFSRDYNYCFELDLSQMEETEGKNYMWNTDSEFLANYLYSKLINKYKEPIEPGDDRFGFMFRSSENELMDSLSSYMPVKVPTGKSKSEFTTFYKWDGSMMEWVSSETEPSGTNKGVINKVEELPSDPDNNDYYQVTAYYPSNSIVFRIANENGANVSVVGNKDDITIYGFDPTTPSGGAVPLYTMKSATQESIDAHRYFTYDTSGATATEAIPRGGDMKDGDCLYGHIFKLAQGDYVIGAKNGTANIYFLGVQGQTDGTIGSNTEATIGNGVTNVEFLLEQPTLSDYSEATGIAGSKVAYSSFKGIFNNESGTFAVTTDTIDDKKCLKLTYGNTGIQYVTYLLTYITNPDRKMKVNSIAVNESSRIIVGGS